MFGIGVCGAGKRQVKGRLCLGRREACMRWGGFVHERAGRRRRRSAGYDSYPPPVLGLPIQSGCLMDQQRPGCWRVRRGGKERR